MVSIVQTGSNAKTVYTTNHHLGSPRINTDATGQVISRHDYHPFGEEIARTGYGSDTIRKQFTGYERDDETGLDFAQARYYAVTLGRFSSPDEPFADQFEDDPQSSNLYLYVRNNPLNLTDPFGTTTVCPKELKCVERNGEYFYKDEDGNETQQAVEALKKFELKGNDFHEQIMSNGNVQTKTGEIIGNIFQFIP